MRANLYIHPDAIKCEATDVEQEYLAKFKQLVDDLIEIKTDDYYSDDNIIYLSEDLYTTSLLNGKNIFEIASILGREENNFLYSVIGNTSPQSNLSLKEIRELCKYRKEETECNSTIYLSNPFGSTSNNKYICFDEYAIVCGKDTWHTFRRQIIGNHPGNPQDFIEECKIHFPKIIFHVNCLESLKGYLDVIPRKIVYYLSCMNDKLLEYKDKSGIKDINTLLERFCTEYGFDEPGSLQRTAYKKELYSYSFLKCGCEDKPCNYKIVTCDPHMKISSCDDQSKNIVARIYFHFGDDEIAKGKVLVGSIGPHV